MLPLSSGLQWVSALLWRLLVLSVSRGGSPRLPECTEGPSTGGGPRQGQGQQLRRDLEFPFTRLLASATTASASTSSTLPQPQSFTTLLLAISTSDLKNLDRVFLFFPPGISF